MIEARYLLEGSNKAIIFPAFLVMDRLDKFYLRCGMSLISDRCSRQGPSLIMKPFNRITENFGSTREWLVNSLVLGLLSVTNQSFLNLC